MKRKIKIQKLYTAASLERHPVPEFLASIPIRKTRAGLQFTCAAPTLGNQKDVWVCNSDGYVGQVCVLSLLPEPTVTSCNGVCNARILCVASVPTTMERYIHICLNLTCVVLQSFIVVFALVAPAQAVVLAFLLKMPPLRIIHHHR